VTLCITGAVLVSTMNAGAAVSAASGPISSTQTSASASRPADPEAATAMAPVTRGGKAPLVITKASAQGSMSAGGDVTYSDGVTIRIDDVRNGVEQGQGPGVFHGRPYTVLTLVVLNGSPAAVDLNQVVVTATYGSPAIEASPVYEDPQAQDFSGVAAPGGSASAMYAFAIPPSGRGSAALQVDFDAAHDPAVFSGGLR